MQLREDRTYRTRDGSRTGVRVRKGRVSFRHTDERDFSPCYWNADGTWDCAGKTHDRYDLIEETPAPPDFSYAACPVGEDGRRRAVTRDGREVVLLCDDAPGTFPLLGWISGENLFCCWATDGGPDLNPHRLFVPPPPKRVVWVNLYPTMTLRFDTQKEADDHALPTGWRNRLGGHAYKIEL